MRRKRYLTVNIERPLLILGALESETELLITSLTEAEEIAVGDYRFFKGKIAGKPVIVCRCLIGMIYSAAAVMLGAERFSPRAVIIGGTSGAHDAELHQGDIILGENLRYVGRYDTPHRDRGEGSDCMAWEFPQEECFEEGGHLYTYSAHSSEALLSAAETVEYSGGRVKRGTVLSSDEWNREIDRILDFHAAFSSDCEDMESFAVARICEQLSLPFLCVRIISNSELHPGEECDFALYGRKCQEFVLKLIEKV